MKLKDFLKEKAIYIACHLLVAAMTFLMLAALNPFGGLAFSVYLFIFYLIGGTVPLAVEFRRKSRYYNLLLSSFDRLEFKNLIAEIIPEPDFIEAELIYNLLKASNKASLEEINKYKNMQEEYREYIEMWVHEIKTPISSSRLIAQNTGSKATDSILEELGSIEDYVEQVLFYARSTSVEKDYTIKEICLEKPVYAVLKRNSKQLIGAGISVSVVELNIIVYSDSKWIEFILNQLIINSIKYSRESEAKIELRAIESDNSCILLISDNGLGIPDNELPRIFDKGFTGTNGRLRGKSTGMGLYICKKLCDSLGVSITAESTYGCGTTISIVFPKSSMTNLFK